MHNWQDLASSLSVFGTGLLLVGMGLAVKRLVRFCRHKRMGWPIRQGGHTYQACLDCGIQRPFDEKRFTLQLRPHSDGNYGRTLTLVHPRVRPVAVQCVAAPPQHRLYFLPEPHGHGSFRPTLRAVRRALDVSRTQVRL